MRTDMRFGAACAAAVLAAGLLAGTARAQGVAPNAAPGAGPKAALGAAVDAAPTGAMGATVKLSLSADDAFEKGMGAWGLQRSHKGGVELYDHVLVEDDGPGIGSDVWWLVANRSPTVEMSGQRMAKKVLVVDRPEASAAKLYVRPWFKVEFNGKVLDAPGGSEYRDVPVGLIRKGENTVIVSKDGDANGIKVAAREDILLNDPDRKDRPARSFQSADGGKTWTPLDGEMLVRLHLVQYVPEGRMISPVIDLAGGDESSLPLPGAVSIESVSLKAQGDSPAGTSVELVFRAGTTPVYAAASWGDWQAPLSQVAKGRRYLQWQAVLKAGGPTATPVLKGVELEAKVARSPLPDWAGKVRLAGFQNEEIRYTSIPFEYEDPLHPRMVALRKKYALDEIVKDGATEFDKLLRLRDWVAHQWRYKAPENYYPAWDADDILQHKVGFCVQYAIAYMQCAISLGYQARFVYGNHPDMSNGHEVTEVWSNQYKKWVYMDNLSNFHHVDPRTNVPMSMTEVHDVLVKTYCGDSVYQLGSLPKAPKTSPDIATCFALQTVPGKPRRPTADGFFEVPSRWLIVRMMPRNNFYSHQYPVPKVQGTNWDWPDYSVLADRHVPTSWEYRNLTERRSDWNWTINQVRFDVSAGEKPGTLQVQMGTVTPAFETFLTNADGQGWREAGGKVAWELRPGKNRLEMRARNDAGVEGPVSHVEVEYQKEATKEATGNRQ
jgi:transglutaminase-like putative cysteine protease